MGDLSKNFSTHEFACPCCGKVEVSPRLVETLQTLRDETGSRVFINSGYRCEEHNRKVGGVADSQHLLGTAADIRVEGWPSCMVMGVLRMLVRNNVCYVGYAYEISPTAVHVDVREPESQTVQAWRG